MVSLSFPFWESYWLKMSLEKKKKKKKNRTGWKTLFNSNSENRAFKPSSTLHPEDPNAVAYLEGSGVPVK